MAAKGCREQVLGTTELLQNVLLHLDLKTLLVSAQRVERRWRDLIIDSAPIQRALYFRGDPEPRHEEEEQRMPSTAIHEEEDAAAADDDDVDSIGNDSGSWADDRFEMNPLLQAKFDQFFCEAGPVEIGTGHRPRRQSRLLTSDRCKDLPLAGSEAQREAFLRPGASWRRMLVTQPPVRRLGFCESGRNMGDAKFRFSELRPTSNDDDGLRMGELYDAVVNWLGTPHPAFTVMWNPSEYVWPRFQYRDIKDILDSGGDGGVPVAEPCRVIDLLIKLSSTTPSCLSPPWEDMEQEQRQCDEWKGRFAFPEIRGQTPVQAAEPTRWKTCGLDGCEAELEFGGVVYW
ncbi:hypothetical protein PG989_004496 [Apiospora arundinis]